jgi:hypothetical protein
MLYWIIFKQCLQTCYTQLNLIWPSRPIPVTLRSSCQSHMGHLLYPPYSTKSLTRCSNIWTRHAICILLIADRKKFGEHRQKLTDLNTACENKGRINYDYKVGQKILVRNKGLLRKAESRWQKGPWTITTVHTNVTITIQHGNNKERLNMRKVKPFEE